MHLVQAGVGRPFRSGALNLIANPDFACIDLQEFAELAWAFMTGVPGGFSTGFRIMGPDELKRQRWTYVKYWADKLNHMITLASR